jgi:hypothetical protein
VKSAQTSSPTIFTESIFPAALQKAAMDGYTTSQESFASIFQDQAKYIAIMNAVAGIFYRNAQLS